MTGSLWLWCLAFLICLGVGLGCWINSLFLFFFAEGVNSHGKKRSISSCDSTIDIMTSATSLVKRLSQIMLGLLRVFAVKCRSWKKSTSCTKLELNLVSEDRCNYSKRWWKTREQNGQRINDTTLFAAIGYVNCVWRLSIRHDRWFHCFMECDDNV